MAKRRLFSQTITETDAFLDMPLTAQGLYFHLGMNADDDGFVSPRKIMRMIGSNADDLKVLIAKRFILSFDSGVVVIKHWLINNSIRNDRYHATTYQKELATLTKNEFGSYTELQKITTEQLELTELEDEPLNLGIPLVAKMEPEVKLSEAKLSKAIGISTNVDRPKTASPDIDEMFEYWKRKTGMGIGSNVKRNRYACSNLMKRHGKEQVARLIDGVALTQEDRYAPRIVDFVSLQSKLNDLMVWGKKRGITENAAKF